MLKWENVKGGEQFSLYKFRKIHKNTASDSRWVSHVPLDKNCPLVALTSKGAGELRTRRSPPWPSSLDERSQGRISSQQNHSAALLEENSIICSRGQRV